jgi:hypothetical protein
VTTTQATHGGASGRAAAELEGLRELFGVFTHDLSNPLQSLTVLCELALSDTPPGSDQHERASQSLEATQRMNALVLAVSKVARSDGPRHVGGILERFVVLFARRFDRYDVAVARETSAIDDVVPPPALEQALLNLMLAAIARFTTERRRQGFSLSLRGSRPSPALHPTRCTIEIDIGVAGEDGTRHQLGLPDTHCSRVSNLVAAQTDLTFEYGDGVGRLTFDGSGA